MDSRESLEATSLSFPSMAQQIEKENSTPLLEKRARGDGL
jgi:hypothetical protein